jgi:hypothetical protein
MSMKSSSLRSWILAVCMLSVASQTRAFSILGPFAAYQSATLSYGGVDMGGPMNLGEEYRVNFRGMTYAFDATFLSYFGNKGVTAVQEAIGILNQLPSASTIDRTLDTFPLQSKGPKNFTAESLGILDLKSETLGILFGQLGVGNPERWTWTLRDQANTNYTVIMRNFDPGTWLPTNLVNGTLYTYRIEDPVSAILNSADAVEVLVDPLSFDFTSVSGVENPDPLRGSNLRTGEYFTGLTRDDAAAMAYIYRARNFNVENTISTLTLATNVGGPWVIPGTSNSLTTNVLVDIALRPGIENIDFRRVDFDSLLGTTINVTNRFTDQYVTNGYVTNQVVDRPITAPDIVFFAADIPSVNGVVVPLFRTPSANWVDNSALNTSGGGGAGGAGGDNAGPGTIEPTIVITFNKLGPFIINTTPTFLTEATGTPGFRWGHFDTTTFFAVFPDGQSIRDIEAAVRFQ